MEDDGSTLYAVESKKPGAAWRILNHTISFDRSYVTDFLQRMTLEKGEDARLVTFERSYEGGYYFR